MKPDNSRAENTRRSSTSFTDVTDVLRKIQDLLVSRAVNKHASDNVYQMLRAQLMSEPSTRRSLPRLVRDCSDLDEFWGFIQRKFSTYKERREYVITAFAPLLARHGTLSRAKPAGRIFIGHGRSQLWRALKDFLADRLGLEWEEFNREPVAGKSTKERLEEMLGSASFALLVMTAEEERPSGTAHARDNVIHEAGLFQGRLGFSRAIILLEDGCSTFSNVEGLTYISFPHGSIESAFENVRLVLEREGFVQHPLPVQPVMAEPRR